MLCPLVSFSEPATLLQPVPKRHREYEDAHRADDETGDARAREAAGRCGIENWVNTPTFDFQPADEVEFWVLVKSEVRIRIEPHTDLDNRLAGAQPAREADWIAVHRLIRLFYNAAQPNVCAEIPVELVLGKPGIAIKVGSR